MLELLISNLLWLVQLPILPLYYHLPEWFWLAISLDKINGVFETYGIYLITLGLTACAVYYRNSLLRLFFVIVSENNNMNKVRTSLLTVLKSCTLKLTLVKSKLKTFLK